MLNVNGKLPGTGTVEVSGMSDEHVLQKVLSVVTTLVKTVAVIGKSSVPGAGVGVSKFKCTVRPSVESDSAASVNVVAAADGFVVDDSDVTSLTPSIVNAVMVSE